MVSNSAMTAEESAYYDELLGRGKGDPDVYGYPVEPVEPVESDTD